MQGLQVDAIGSRTKNRCPNTLVFVQTKVRGCVEEGGNPKAQQASADDEFGPQPAGLTEEATEEKEEQRDEDMSDKERIRETEELLGEKAEE